MSLRFRFTKNQEFTNTHGAIVVDTCNECQGPTGARPVTLQEVADAVYYNGDHDTLAQGTWASSEALAENCDWYEQEFAYEGGGYTCVLCDGEVVA